MASRSVTVWHGLQDMENDDHHLPQRTVGGFAADTKATHKNSSQDRLQPNPDEIRTKNIQNTPPGLYPYLGGGPWTK